MSDCSGDNRLIDYSPEYKDVKGGFVDFGNGTPVTLHGILPTIDTINFDPPLKE